MTILVHMYSSSGSSDREFKEKSCLLLREKSERICRSSGHPPVRGKFLTFSVLVANLEKLLYTVANPARGLQRLPPTLLVRRKYDNNHVTRLHASALRRSRSVSRPYKYSSSCSLPPRTE